MNIRKYIIKNNEGMYYVTGLGHFVFSSEISQAQPFYLLEEVKRKMSVISKYLPREYFPLEILEVNVVITEIVGGKK